MKLSGTQQRWLRACGVALSGTGGLLSASIVSVSAQVAYNVSPMISSSTISVQPTKHARPRVTLMLKDSTIKFAVTAIARAAGLQVVYDNANPKLTKRITVHIVDMDAMDAFAVVLKGTGLTATLTADGETVVIREHADGAAASHAQGAVGIVTGEIVDSASGKAIGGATVAVQGSKVSAVTSETGDFLLRDVPDGTQMLTIKSFGYKPSSREVTVTDSGRITLRVVLVPTATVLSGVVTTATGEQSRMSVGSDITTINVDSVMKTAPISTVTDLLANRVPGLTIVHTTGTPGDPSRLLLRGAGSVLGANNPIVVVDGVRVYYPQDLGDVQNQVRVNQNDIAGATVPRPSPLDQIDPNTIATIEVLKGPSASALYGSDAANGVIIITTKKGQPGQTQWSVSADEGTSYIPGSYPENTFVFGHINGGSNIGIQHGETNCVGGLIFTYGSAALPCVVDSTVTFQTLNDPRFSPLTHGALSTGSVSVSGGAQALTYAFTGSGSNEHGMTRLPTAASQNYETIVGTSPPAWMAHPDDYQTWNVSGTMTAALSRSARLTVSDVLSNSTQHRTNLGLSAVGILIGAYVDTSNVSNIPALNQFMTQITQATFSSTTDATLQWPIRPWLPLTITTGLNQTNETDKDYLPAGLPAAVFDIGNIDTSGGYSLGLNHATVTTLNANTIIPVPLGHGMKAQLAMGTNIVEQTTAAQNITTSSIPVGVSDPTIFLQTTATSVAQQTQSTATYGWFFEPQLSTESRFYLTPGIRLDGGSASGGNAGLTAFPKVNFSYLAVDQNGASHESGWTSGLTSWLTQLRLRGAVGMAGVQPAPGQNLRLFTAPQLVSLDGGTVASNEEILSSLGNTTLHPERSQEMELGFDAAAFQNRFSLTATYYDKLRLDAIESVPVAPSVVGVAGGGVEFLNIGNIRNTGLEFTAQAQIIQSGPVSWGVNGMVSTNDNRVVATTAKYAASCTGGFTVINPCARVGYPLGAVFAPQIVGFADANDDGLIEPNEIQYSDSGVYIGSTDPRYTASFGTTMSFWSGRMTVNASGDYKNGLTINNAIITNTLESAANALDADLYAKALGIATASGAAGTAGPSVTYATVNVLRFDALSVTWILPSAVAHAFRGRQASLSLQGGNLGLRTNYRGKDPDVNANVDGFSVGDNGVLPQPRTWRVGVRVTQ